MKQEVSRFPLKHTADMLWVGLHRGQSSDGWGISTATLFFSNLFLSGVVIPIGQWVTQLGRNDEYEGSKDSQGYMDTHLKPETKRY